MLSQIFKRASADRSFTSGDPAAIMAMMRRPPRVKTLLRRLVHEPLLELTIRRAAFDDVARARQVEDQLPLFRADRPFRPRDVKDGDEGQQPDRVGREPELLDLFQELRIVDPASVTELFARPLGGAGLAHPLEELQILLVEVVLFVSPLVPIVAHDPSRISQA